MFKRTPKAYNTSTNYGSRGGGYRNRGGRGGGNTTTKLRGLFSKGTWYCDCRERQPAEHFKVKKEGKNQGRWFYTCQNKEDQRCDFFLWDEDAKPREEAAVLGNSRSEPQNIPQGLDLEMEESSRGGDVFPGRRNPSSPDRTQSPTPTPYKSQGLSSTTLTQSTNGTQKRKLDATAFDDPDSDEEPFPWPLTGQEEEELAQAVDQVRPETPRKVARTDAYATPAMTGNARKLPWLDYSSEAPPPQLQTPSISKPVSPPATTTSTTIKTPQQQPGATAGLRDGSPTPSRFRDALANPAPPPTTTSTLVDDVLSLLHNADVALPGEQATALRATLARHDMRTQGIAKGREISRLGLKAKDAKIVELQARIASLEAEREVDRSVIRMLRFEAGRTAAAVDEEE